MKRVFCILFSFFLILILPVTALAAEDDDRMIIDEDQVVNRDVFAAAGYIRNMGTVNGDFFAAGGDFENIGLVTGDILLASGNANIGGTVQGNLRVAAGQTVISGEIGKSVTAFVSDLTLEKGGAIDGSMNAFAGNLKINGVIGGDLRSGAGTLQINGEIKGDVELDAEHIYFGPEAKIRGNLTYISEKKIDIPQGVVSGRVVQKIPKKKKDPTGSRAKLEEGLKVFYVVRKGISLLSYLIVGTLLVLIFPHFMKNTASTIHIRPWYALGIGIVGLIVIPIASILVMITVIGIPIGIISLMLYGILVYLSKLPAALWIGSRILKNGEKPLLPMILGILILLLISYIPYIGKFVSLVAVVFGVGTFLMNIKKIMVKSKDIEPLP